MDPRRIQTPNIHERFDLSKNVIRGAILPYMEKDPMAAGGGGLKGLPLN